MDGFYDYLRNLGIVDPPDVLDIFQKLSSDKIMDVAERCYVLTETSNSPPQNGGIFNFSASSTLSGGAHPCSEINCRVNNMYELATFSALYADKVIIPNPFEHIYHKITSESDFANFEQFSFFTNRLAGDIIIMLNFRPLIEAGILTINPQLRTYCRECLAKKFREEKQIMRAFRHIEERIINNLNQNVKFILDTDKTIITNGPKNYTGGEVIRFAILPKELAIYKKKIPYIFKPDEIKKLGLWQPFIIPAFEDLILQKLSMLNLNTSYLTNRKIEAEIIEHLNIETEQNPSEKAIVDGLYHELPFIENVSLSTLINTRKQETEAFNTYRDEVKKIIIETKNETNSAIIKKLVNEKIRPNLNTIDKILKNHRSHFIARGKRKIIYNSLIFTAGFFASKMGGVDFSTVLEIGGAFKIKKIYNDFVKAWQIPQKIKNSNYYFLWKLKQET